MKPCWKHLYRSYGRSANRNTNIFKCLKCGMKIAIPHQIVEGLVTGKTKRLRRRHIHQIK